jgi:hypothetical protein
MFVSSFNEALSSVANFGIYGMVNALSGMFEESIGLYFLIEEALKTAISLIFFFSSSSYFACYSLLSCS